MKKLIATSALLALGVLGAAAQAQTVTYLHTDALGTPIAVTDAAGNIIETSEYSPYGDLLNRPDSDGPGYAGHVQDAATGMTYMQQRYYDPSLGRFLSTDPIMATVTNVSRYAYVGNNPYGFTDPDGRYRCKAGEQNCNKVRESVKRIRRIARESRSLRTRAQMGEVASFYGTEGDDNGVTVYSGAGVSNKGKNGEQGGGTVWTDAKGVTSLYIDFQGLAGIESEFERHNLQDLVDAFVVHEGSHGAEQRNRFRAGLPPMYSRADLRWSEYTANWREVIYFKAMGRDAPWLQWTKHGGINIQLVDEYVRRSLSVSDEN